LERSFCTTNRVGVRRAGAFNPRGADVSARDPYTGKLRQYRCEVLSTRGGRWLIVIDSTRQDGAMGLLVNGAVEGG